MISPANKPVILVEHINELLVVCVVRAVLCLIVYFINSFTKTKSLRLNETILNKYMGFDSYSTHKRIQSVHFTLNDAKLTENSM